MTILAAFRRSYLLDALTSAELDRLSPELLNTLGGLNPSAYSDQRAALSFSDV